MEKKEWRFVVNLQPVPTPRPQFKYNANNKSVITYYHENYTEYLKAIESLLIEADAYNDDFYEVMSSKLGVRAEVYFYLQVPKSQKKINNIMRTTAPDIDNLLKAILDGIFNRNLKITDSRIVMVQMAKFQTMDDPRTEIILRGVE